MIRSLLLLACLTLVPLVPAGSAEAAACRAGPPEPVIEHSGGPTLRPAQTAVCDYDTAELNRRLGQLFETKTRVYSVDYAEQLFAIPPMTTAYDSTRDANYTTVLSGSDGWTLRLWVRESFYPLDDSLPPRFEAGLHPRRLADIQEADVRFDITVTLPEGVKPGAGRCLTAAEATAKAAAAGWIDGTQRALLSVTDAGATGPLYKTTDGRAFSLRITQAGRTPTPAELAAACLTSITIMQDPAKAP